MNSINFKSIRSLRGSFESKKPYTTHDCKVMTACDIMTGREQESTYMTSEKARSIIEKELNKQ